MANTRSEGDDSMKDTTAETNLDDQREARRAEYEKRMESDLRQNGNLTAQEIQQLLTFECRQAPANVEEQLKNYFLQLKDRNPTRAKAMEVDIQPLLTCGVKTVEDLRVACEILGKYWSGFVLHFNGESYGKHFFPTAITVQQIDPSTKTSPTTKIGDGRSFEAAMSEVRVEDVLSARMRNEQRKFALQCPEGGSFLGAVIGGRTITCLQHGRVWSYDEEIGTYDDKGVQSGNRNMVISLKNEIGVEPKAEQVGTLKGGNLRDVIDTAKQLSTEKKKPVSFIFEGVLLTVHPQTSEYEVISAFNSQKE